MISMSMPQGSGNELTQDTGEMLANNTSLLKYEADELETIMAYELDTKYKVNGMIEKQNEYFAMIEEILRYLKFSKQDSQNGWEELQKQMSMLIISNFGMIYELRSFGETNESYIRSIEGLMSEMNTGQEMQMYMMQCNSPLEMVLVYEVNGQDIQLNQKIIKNIILEYMEEKNYQIESQKKSKEIQQENYEKQTSKLPKLKALYDAAQREEEVPAYSTEQEKLNKPKQYEQKKSESLPLEKTVDKDYSKHKKTLQNYHHQPQSNILKNISRLDQKDHYNTAQKSIQREYDTSLHEKIKTDYVKPEQNYQQDKVNEKTQSYAKINQNYHHKQIQKFQKEHAKIAKSYHQEPKINKIQTNYAKQKTYRQNPVHEKKQSYAKIDQNYHHKPAHGLQKNHTKAKQDYHHRPEKKLMENYARSSKNYHHKLQDKPNNYMKQNQNYHTKTTNQARNDYAAKPARNYSNKDIRQSYGQTSDNKLVQANYGMRQQTSKTPFYLRKENCMGPRSISRLNNYNHMKGKYSRSNAFAPKSSSLGTSGLGARKGMAKAK